MSQRLAKTQDYASLLSKYDTWMFDCDGVLWHGDKLVDGAIQVLDMLRKQSASLLVLCFLG
jgi:4-nitrophenyl phosphatase